MGLWSWSASLLLGTRPSRCPAPPRLVQPSAGGVVADAVYEASQALKPRVQRGRTLGERTSSSMPVSLVRDATWPVRGSISHRCSYMRRTRPVAAATVAVAGQLPRDRRRAAAQPRRDRPHRLTRRSSQCDLLPIGERQIAALQVPATTWTHPTGLAQPRQPSMSMSARRRGRIGQELPGLPRRPERLVQLGDQLVRETHTYQHPHRIKQVLRPPREPRQRLLALRHPQYSFRSRSR